MNTTPPRIEPPEKSWVSAFLLVFGLLSVLIAGFAIVSGSLFAGLLGILVATVLFALRRIIDQRDSTAHRLGQIEAELESRRGGGA